jgi:hypothetical protein
VETKHLQKRPSLASLLCYAGAALAIAAFSPQSASAAAPTAANAKILNVVTVTYFDATGTTSHQAATSTSVTVSLKQAALTVATESSFATVDSGTTTTSYVALTSNANGQDSYKITFSDVAANLAASPKTLTYNIVTDKNGSNPVSIGSGGSVSLGASLILSVGAPGTTQVISIPAGTLNGIAAGSIVVVGGTTYKVTSTYAGIQAGYDKTGPQTVTGALTNETPGTITIAADISGSDPNLTGSVAGTVIGERKYLKITENATVNSNTANGTDNFSVTTDTTTGSNPTAAVAELATFYYVAVSIDKSVKNINTGVTGLGVTGKPGEVLEYTVTVSNATSGNANLVAVADAVPAYTKLVSGTGAYGSGGGSGAAVEKFAQISDGINTVEVTLDPTDSETQPGGATLTGFGGTVGNAVAAGTGINFFIGTSSNKTTGGVVAAGKTYTIKYRVTIN